jgi:hypothetical protein
MNMGQGGDSLQGSSSGRTKVNVLAEMAMNLEEILRADFF